MNWSNNEWIWEKNCKSQYSLLCSDHSEDFCFDCLRSSSCHILVSKRTESEKVTSKLKPFSAILFSSMIMRNYRRTNEQNLILHVTVVCWRWNDLTKYETKMYAHAQITLVTYWGTNKDISANIHLLKEWTSSEMSVPKLH